MNKDKQTQASQKHKLYQQYQRAYGVELRDSLELAVLEKQEGETTKEWIARLVDVATTFSLKTAP